MGPNERSLLKAAGQNDLNEVARLIREGANPSAINDEGEGPLTRAIVKKNYDVAKYLLEHGATTDYSGFLVHKPLHTAVQTGIAQIA
jgi:ankyrin repeat protein